MRSSRDGGCWMNGAADISNLARSFGIRDLARSPVRLQEAARELEPTVLYTDFGQVTVLSGRQLTEWLNGRPRAGLSSGWVERLVAHVEATAVTREGAQAPKSWWIRRLARVS